MSSPTQVRASHILLKHTGSRNPVDSYRNKQVTRSKQDAIDGIEQIKSQISSHEDFVRLAQEFSECRSAANGGDLGVFGRGQMQQQFEEAAFALQVGELSGLVDSDSGIHIILRLG
ncbi:peptidyl-prolyl cis-trans isomerase nima-interacting 1 [Stylonychia lemnae]|uniref:Peptidyl-prolyl cis-trans isomerase n=1 Tax=Stylonychia lemnae TaxID=5949 RepID=A0A077ZQD7_STYLE|nr:peptidyl-prolyl cis-trans isomerase nima-interacting 1 [Stylonychia lemnae]|eukprot:CDW72112.1 peptidyl-prolyl cis-trans isomerase nima-interacting 1 [Stylonychia lemnae]